MTTSGEEPLDAGPGLSIVTVAARTNPTDTSRRSSSSMAGTGRQIVIVSFRHSGESISERSRFASSSDACSEPRDPVRGTPSRV